jgi:hypothetical protein
MDLQKLMDMISEQGRDARQKYMLSLGDFIETLSNAPHDSLVFLSTSTSSEPSATMPEFNSYRGYYHDIALEPWNGTLTVEQLLSAANDACGRTFEGYKGGDFTMDADTPLWIANYGSASGIAIRYIDVRGSSVTIITFQTED